MKKKRNKQYRPKECSTGGGLVALAKLHFRAEDAAPIVKSAQRDLSYSYWAALENLRSGPADYDAWECLVSTLNIGMALCEGGIGPEYVDEMVVAQEAAVRAKVRADEGKSYRLDGDGIAIITEALRTHDVQLEHAQRKEVTAAIRLVRQRVADGNVFKIERAAS